MWPDNEQALHLFARVGTRWVHPAMGGPPIGLRWEAIYPLMDRLQLDNAQWAALHEDLMSMEQAAMQTMREHAPKPK